MQNTYSFTTEAEAIAFIDGVNVVDDFDVSTSRPKKEDGEWKVVVSVGEPIDEDEDDEEDCNHPAI